MNPPDSNTTQPQQPSEDPNIGKASEGKAEVPGAYPEETEGSSKDMNHALAAAQQKAQEAFVAAEQAAKEYYPVAQQKAQGMYETAEQVAREHLPTGVVEKLEKAGVISGSGQDSSHRHENHDHRPAPSTLPTQETGPFHPSHGGVGMLPGSRSEQSVAKLPEERLEDLRTELPSREDGEEAFRPTHGGVGTLPGGKDEAGVAILPEERKSGSMDKDAGLEAGTGDLTTGSNGASNVNPPKELSPTSEPKENTQNGSRNGHCISGTQPSAGTAAADPTPQSVSEDIDTAKPSPGGHQPSTDIASQSVAPKDTDTGNAEGEETHQGASGTKRKVSLLQKVKGEAKIFEGKITGDKSKVEEGKDIRSGNV
ncbi:hypothetical protein BU17DRAFT_71467 [Hysterangium stoloniferum]|nr:hypothetical protein BU17DRAFT_71467 [Hysterangium stoloniferum]